MNFKKILAAVAAGALALSLFSFSASAAEELTFTMNVRNDPSWVDHAQSITINGNGTYDYTVDLSDDPAVTWPNFNTPASESAPAEYAGSTITLESFKINGVEWPVAPDGLNTREFVAAAEGSTNPTVNFNFWNTWYTEGNMIDMTNAKFTPNLGYSFLDADGKAIEVTEFSFTFTIDGVGGEFAGGTASPSTGNVPVIALGAVMALAVAGAVISRKRR
jgi:hypothetical protein